MEYYPGIEKNEILPFAATWMDLEGITLSEISQRKTNITWYRLNVEYKKWCKWTYLQNRNRVTDVEKKLMVSKGDWGEEGINWEIETDIYTLQYIK